MYSGGITNGRKISGDTKKLRLSVLFESQNKRIKRMLANYTRAADYRQDR